ncbi:hypothetical protein BZG36_03420 [Bifiguratus adelaidae]|uniref:FAS1 domain-containing protein n=1 Tax=Bifiguratus adelaidae TaxID=1938954 RepID=A0A261XYZ0_9FUNG|nr:hypothetical protein BZG36_03420 [Bifiguratus adelaidae]
MYASKLLLLVTLLTLLAVQGIHAFDDQLWFAQHTDIAQEDERDIILRRVEPSDTLYDIIAKDEHFSILAKIVSEDDVLKNAINDTRANLTLFAPTDEAFKRLSRYVKHKPSKERLQEIVLYHIAIQEYMAKELAHQRVVQSCLKVDGLNGNNQRLRVGALFGRVYINYAKVIQKDIKASNGFSTLTSALQQVDIAKDVEEAKGITVFAPTNCAFAKLGFGTIQHLFGPHGKEDLKKVLAYHVVPHAAYSSDLAPPHGGRRGIKHRHLELDTWEGGHLNIDATQFGSLYLRIKIDCSAKVVFDDLLGSNGVAHVIDQVLIPPEMNKSAWSSTDDLRHDVFPQFN